ncbi:MAG TPA: hypothetical protein VF406_09070 [Thermodesulfobacteriota bacterium]
MRCVPAVVAALLLLGMCGPAAGREAPPAGGRTVIDSAGRSVRLPARIERVYAAGHPAVVLLYTLAPDRLLGWTRRPTEEEKPFLLPATRDLPEYGRLTGRGDTANVEVVLAARPDLILDYGSVTPTSASLAGRGRLASVSLEQVLLWNPEVVLTLDWVFFADGVRRPEWEGVDAVRAGRVYMVPRLPFPWFDRPPSVNRLIGVRWLLHLLYPAAATGDLGEAAR